MLKFAYRTLCFGMEQVVLTGSVFVNFSSLQYFMSTDMFSFTFLFLLQFEELLQVMDV